MKKNRIILFTVLALILLAGLAFAASEQYLNQMGVDFFLAPETESEMNYLPLKPLAEYYGMTLSVNDKDKEIRGRWGKTDFLLKFDSRVAEVGSTRLVLDNPVINVNGHILVPTTFLENMLKVDFKWRKPGSIIIKEKDPLEDVKITLYTNKEKYDFREQIVVTMIIKNSGPFKLRVPLTSSQVYDLTLSYKGYEIWRWSKDKMFTSAMTTYELEPGESKVYNITLPRELVLTPSQYQLQGIFISKPEVKSEVTTLTVQ